MLIGWYNNEAHFEWILKSGLYNYRMDTERGLLRMSPEVTGAQYLLLLSDDGVTSQRLMRVSKGGPRALSREALKAIGYPGEPLRPLYLVFDLVPAEEFQGYQWNYKKLPERLQNGELQEPKTVSLDTLMGFCLSEEQ